MTSQPPARDRLFALIASIPGSGSVEWCGLARALLDEIEASPPGRRLGPVRVGSLWVWEPLKPHVRQDVRVAAVEERRGKWWVQTENITANDGVKAGDRHWNELDRFVEACVLVTPAGGM